MIKVNPKNEVLKAQALCDKIAPGKVKVYVTKSERGVPVLCGEYECYDGEKTSWVERMDRYYTDCKLFMMFFEQRKDWLNASIKVKAFCSDNSIHPSEYKSDMVLIDTNMDPVGGYGLESHI